MANQDEDISKLKDALNEWKLATECDTPDQAKHRISEIYGNWQVALRPQPTAPEEWDGKERRCEHDMKWISDWYGDPGVINGTADCSQSECKLCGWIDPNGEPPQDDYEY